MDRLISGGLVPDVRRIAVLRANALGDYLVSEPALRAVRVAYPEARIVLVGAPWQPGFLGGRPGPVDEVRVLPAVTGLGGQAAGSPPAGRLTAFLDRMRGWAPDLALQMQGGGAVSNPLVSAFGARVTAGARAEGAAPLDRAVAYRYYQHEVDRYLEIAGLVGAPPVGPTPTTPHVALTAADHHEAQELLGPGRPGPLVALHPGVSDPRRRWPTRSFVAVAGALHRAGARLVLTGSAADAGLTRPVARAVPAPVLDLTGRTTIGGLGAVFTRCAVVAGVDTGPLHLARAVGAATVTVFWCGNAINAGPATRARHRALLSWTLRCPRCGAPCHSDIYPHRDLGRGCDHPDSFVEEVPPAEMADEILDLLADGV